MLSAVVSRVGNALEISTMAIQPIGVTTSFGQGNTLAAISSTRPDRPTPSTTVPTSTPTEPAPDDTDTNKKDHAPGVLRLLESGHFQGVSDLRLRMVFGDQIRDAGIELPELSAPKGKGVAYAKFLEQYMGLPGSPSADADPTPTLADQAVVSGDGDLSSASIVGSAGRPINTLA